MRALLDAHAFIWWVLDTPQLSATCRDIVSDGDNEVYFSVASAYEIAYKADQGRLSLPAAPEAFVRDRLATNGFVPLRIELAHALRAAVLPHIHRDPFDRLLVAQAQIEGLAILTADPAISRYDVETIW